MHEGQWMMCGGRCVRVERIEKDGVRVRYATSNTTAKVPRDALTEPTEPDEAKRYVTALTPGRVGQ